MLYINYLWVISYNAENVEHFGDIWWSSLITCVNHCYKTSYLSMYNNYNVKIKYSMLLRYFIALFYWYYVVLFLLYDQMYNYNVIWSNIVYKFV
jgi:hypothetical protein